MTDNKLAGEIKLPVRYVPGYWIVDADNRNVAQLSVEFGKPGDAQYREASGFIARAINQHASLVDENEKLRAGREWIPGSAPSTSGDYEISLLSGKVTIDDYTAEGDFTGWRNHSLLKVTAYRKPPAPYVPEDK